MKRIELDKILDKHSKWVDDMKEGERASLPGANLSGANLSRATLSRADLSGANLSGANLSRANLYGATLSRADLSGANLYGAILSGANLSRATLYGANLSGANLSGANLSGANLSRADLSGANLYGANLYGANLYGANLEDTDAINAIMYNLQCPEEGSFIGWKKCQGGIIVKLKITSDALRSSATSRKCRASKVKVLKIFGADKAVSKHDDNFIYKKGDTIEINDFDTDRWQECSTGIHFFITRKEAEEY